MSTHAQKYLYESYLLESENEGFEVKAFSKKLYHGSPVEIKSFEVGKGKGRYGTGLYLTPEKSVAEFYAAGGRQGNAGQKLKNGEGFLYEFTVKGQSLIVIDEQETMQAMCYEKEEAEESLSSVGDPLSALVTKHLGAWADEYHNCKIVWLKIKNAGAMSPLNQVLITDKSVIQSMKAITK